jgi:hypothetical protein
MRPLRRPPHSRVEAIIVFSLSNSRLVMTNMKSRGNRARFRFTAWIRNFVDTPYSRDKSPSRRTLCPLKRRMADSM